MRNQVKWALLTAGLIMVGAGMVQAAGFNIYEAGVRATALGGAFTATADDGSAIFYNAAGLSFLDKSSLSVNLMPIRPAFKFKGATTANGEGPLEESADNTFPVPGLYYANNNHSSVAFGIGIYAPFGLGVEWKNPEEFVGRRVSYDVSIETVYFTPAVSYKVNDNLAVAIGADIATQKLSLNKYTPNPVTGDNAINTSIYGTSELNISGSFGLMYRPDDKVSLGVMYHHKKKMEFKDQATWLENVDRGTVDNPSWSDQLIGGLGGYYHTISSEVNLPSILSLGVAYQISPRVRGEFDYVKFGWDVFEKLDMRFDNPDMNQEIHFNYENSWQIRMGLEYVAIPERLNLMAGYVHDKTPQPLAAVSPLLPDSDRNDYSLGLMYKHGRWDFLGTYMAVIGTERTNIENGQPANPDPAYPVGTYKSVANIFGIGAGYHF